MTIIADLPCHAQSLQMAVSYISGRAGVGCELRRREEARRESAVSRKKTEILWEDPSAFENFTWAWYHLALGALWSQLHRGKDSSKALVHLAFVFYSHVFGWSSDLMQVWQVQQIGHAMQLHRMANVNRATSSTMSCRLGQQQSGGDPQQHARHNARIGGENAQSA